MKQNMPDIPLNITDENTEKFITTYETVVIDCWAAWCKPCIMVHPIIRELAQEMYGKIVFGKLNVDENRSTMTKYQIMSIPTLLIFKDGKLIDRIIGIMPKETIKAKLEKI